MKHIVHLVQRGISSPTHPVSGKSGKLYGQALASPPDQGVLFKMSLEEYQTAAHDLIGNTNAGQQWVPEIVQGVGAPDGATAAQERCGIPAGCPNLATHVWDRFLFCEEHAPTNAVRIGEPPAPKPAPIKVAEARPVLKEFAPVEAKREILPPPAVADANVNAETSRSYPRINVPRPRPPSETMTPAVAAPEPTPAATPPEAGPPLEEMLEEMKYAQLRDLASELGINPVGKNTETLRKLIKSKRLQKHKMSNQALDSLLKKPEDEEDVPPGAPAYVSGPLANPKPKPTPTPPKP